MTKTLRPDGTEAPIGFSLQPIYLSQRRGVMTACVLSCIATGKMIDGMGGPGFALCPEVVKALDSSRNGGKARVIVDALDWDDAIEALRKLVSADDFAAQDCQNGLIAARELLARIQEREKKPL